MYERFEDMLRLRGVKAADVARATGIGRSTFSDWKNGRSKPKREKLVKIAQYLGTTADYLDGSSPAEEVRRGVIVGFGEEQEEIRITESEYEAIRSILASMRSEKDKKDE